MEAAQLDQLNDLKHAKRTVYQWFNGCDTKPIDLVLLRQLKKPEGWTILVN